MSNKTKTITVLSVSAVLIIGAVFLLIRSCRAKEQSRDIPAGSGNSMEETPYKTDRLSATAAPSATAALPESDDGESDTVQAENAVKAKELAFTLTVLGKDVQIAKGVDEKTLDASPGWLTTSAYPGEEGVCVIYGHRNRNHLKILKDIDYGDTMDLTLPGGQKYTYMVESLEILENESELRIPLIDGQHLLLMTCYPFYYTGHAPQKFVCILRRV